MRNAFAALGLFFTILLIMGASWGGFVRWTGKTAGVEIHDSAGTTQLQVRVGYLVVPSCPSSSTGIEFGAICKDLDRNPPCVKVMGAGGMGCITFEVEVD